MQKRTKILATLGPASHEIEIIEGLIITPPINRANFIS